MATAFWIVDQQYVGEAVNSAVSVRNHMPDVRRILFSPDPVYVNSVFDEIRRLPTRQHKWWYIDSSHYFGLAVEGIKDDKLLYFDSDTFMCEPIYDVLELLGRYDIAATHAPGRITSKALDPLEIPEAFPEVNVGVMGVSRSVYTIWLMQRWHDEFRKNPDRYNNNDQGPLRKVLWENRGINLYILPPEYNCRWGFGGFARYRVKVLHGRSKNYAGVCNRLNEKAVMRGWDRGEVN